MSKKNFSKVHGRLIAPGQLWKRPSGLLTWRVMAVSEGYVMGRYKGCAPGIVSVKDMATWSLAQGKGANDGR